MNRTKTRWESVTAADKVRSDLNGGGKNGEKLIDLPLPGRFQCLVPYIY